MTEASADYLLDKKIKIFQPLNGYRASTDAVLLSAAVSGNLRNASILDVGSGTGAVSLCLAHRLQNNNINIIGVETQTELAELSNYSAAQNNFTFLRFINADIRQKTAELSPCSFDVVITNPPYSDHDMPSPNKSKATAHNHSDFNLTQWLNFCLKMTKPFGHIYLINRTEALPEICCALQGKAGEITIIPIISKPAQPVKRIIVTARKDSKAPCRIMPQFIVHNDSGYTTEAQKILRQGLDFENIINNT
jgi:tRNA1(Val) A37 N6-methylase TrmN6